MKKQPRTLAAFAGLAILYLVLSLTLPPNTPTVRQYNLTVPEYQVLVLFVGIPLVAVWFASFYGYTLFESYVTHVRRAREGESFDHLAQGLRILAWGLPIITILTTILGAIVHGYDSVAGAIFIIIHYLPLLVALLAFSEIAHGSRKLTELVHTRPSDGITRVTFLAFTTMGVWFTYLTVRTAEKYPNPFNLPMWLILLTIIVPYLYAWFMGIFASYEIFLYSKRSKGLLYKRSLRNVASGVFITIVTSVIFQYIQADTTRLRRISFSWVFFGIYVLLLLYASGFLLIGHGAKQLKKIEEV